METKLLNLDSTDFKFDKAGALTFSGYASVFDGVDSYGDTIKAGAYKDTLENRERPVQLRWNHYGPVIGKYLSITEDEKGLLVEGELTKGHSVAEDTAALLKHGAISGLSIGYSVKDSEEKDDIRILKSIELFEISVVESPADNAAHISDLKTALSDCSELKEVEGILRKQTGLSQTVITAIVSSVKKAITRGDREGEALKALQNFKLNR